MNRVEAVGLCGFDMRECWALHQSDARGDRP
jgi:hypothetical protein